LITLVPEFGLATVWRNPTFVGLFAAVTVFALVFLVLLAANVVRRRRAHVQEIAERILEDGEPELG
jgi:hypothetical protein